MFKLIILTNKDKGTISFDKAGDYLTFFCNLSGDFRFEIRQKKVNLKIFGIYIGRKNERFNLSLTQHHFQPSSKSTLLIKGVFTDRASFIYRNLIRIEKGGQKTRAYQKNQNLILSKNCFVESKPFLEILTNDVSCGHAATTGQLNSESIFYLKARGINQKGLEKLLVEGFINEVFGKIRRLELSSEDRKKIKFNKL